MKVEIKKKTEDWDKIEDYLGWELNDNYKEIYEVMGDVSIDDLIYIVTPIKKGENYGIKELYSYVEDVHRELNNEGLSIEKLNLYDGEEGWLPVGHTSNGDFIFCQDGKVMIADEGLEEREVYNYSLIKFIREYIRGESRFKFNPYNEKGEEHIIEIS